VVVLDRDQLPERPGNRRETPQDRHAHALLASGRDALEILFSGFTEELVAQGALCGDAAANGRYWQAGGWRRTEPAGVPLVSTTRTALEYAIRRRVVALRGVEIRQQTTVTGLCGTATGITGVRLAGGDVVDAALVVDATGRRHRSDQWLSELGCELPRTAGATVDLMYATQLLRRRRGDVSDGIVGQIIASTPSIGRGGLMMAVDGDRWLVTLAGYHGAHPPADQAGFEAFARTLPQPAIADLLGRAEPVTAIARIRYLASKRRYFEQLRRPPASYLAIGDALCSFNPIYGQGISVAALEANALGRLLDRHGAATGAMVRDWYATVAKAIVGPAWELAAGADWALPATTGDRPRGMALRTWYARQVLLATHVDSDINALLIRVHHLMAPPSTLLRPVLRVLRAARRARRAASAPSGHHDIRGRCKEDVGSG